MAGRMSTLKISNKNGEDFPISIPSKEFANFKISDLQDKLEEVFHVSKDHQRLIFAGQILISERSLSDYGITMNVAIQFASWQENTPEYLEFIHVLSSQTFKPRDLSPFASMWERYGEGLNFQGTCNNDLCPASDESVIVHKGFYKGTGGQCLLKAELGELSCPKCKTLLNEDKVDGIGIFKCKLEVKAKVEDQDEVCYTIDSRKKFLISESLNNHPKGVAFIVLTVKPL